MSEPEKVGNEPEPEAIDDELEGEVAALSVDMGGNRMVPLSALIAAKKELKTSKGRVKELEPIAARATDVDARLSNAQPIIDAIVSNPKLRAEALRIAQGTRVSDDRTAQPDESDDPDAAAYAEDAGFYLSDGQTPDVARARRVLTRLDARHGKQTDDRIRPLAGVTLNQQAQVNLRNAAAQTDDNGVPYATQQSLDEVAKQLPAQLLADPNVVNLLLHTAIGMDRMKGRTPKAVDEPLYMAPAGGGRRSAEPVIDSATRSRLESLGLTEKEYTASAKKLEDGAQNRRGIVLGGK
jgi:hypothetical protein